MRIHTQKSSHRMWIHFGEDIIALERGRLLGLDLGFNLEIDTDDITLGLYLFIVDLYIRVSSKRIRKFLSSHPNKFFTKTWGDGEQGSYWDERSIGVNLDLRQKTFRGELWTDMDNNPRSRHFFIFLDDLILGRAKYSDVVTESGTTKIVMPEGDYEATYTFHTSAWKRPRSPFTQKVNRVSIDLPVGIPHEGKGENSWDCGMDATYGVTMSRKDDESIHDIAQRFALDQLKTRQKYGSLLSEEYAKWREDGLKRKGVK